MQFCFIRDDMSLVMPVTPGQYRVSTGKRMETIRISQLGDVYRPGGRSRFKGSFDFLLPGQEYPWTEQGAVTDPQYYLDYLTAWSVDDKPVRMVVTETEINLLVYIEDVEQGEEDGTGDRYITVSVCEHVDLSAVEVETGAYVGNNGRSQDGVKSTRTESYTIEAGDTLAIICRRFYGKSGATYYNALAAYNGIKNPHLIYVGRTIQIPPEDVLLGVAG